MEGVGHGPIRGAVPASAERDCTKQCRTSVRTDGILAEIVIGHVLNTNQKLLLCGPLPPSLF